MEIGNRCVFISNIECPVLRKITRNISSVPDDIGGITELEITLRIYSVLASFCKSCKIITSIGVKPTEVSSESEDKKADIITELEARYSEYLDIRDIGDKVYILPKKRLGSIWREINEKIRSAGGKWIREDDPMESHWVIERTS